MFPATDPSVPRDYLQLPRARDRQAMACRIRLSLSCERGGSPRSPEGVYDGLHGRSWESGCRPPMLLGASLARDAYDRRASGFSSPQPAIDHHVDHEQKVWH